MAFVEAIHGIVCNPMQEGAWLQHLHRCCREGDKLVDRMSVDVKMLEVRWCAAQQCSADCRSRQGDSSPWQVLAECVEAEVEAKDIGVHSASLAVNLVVMQGVAVHPSHLVLRCWAVGHGG